MNLNFIYKSLIIILPLTAINFFYLKKWILLCNRYSILSYPTKRGLHQESIATSGGSIFVIYLFFILFLNSQKQIDNIYFYIIFFGGFVAIIYGILDDIYNLSAIKKFLTQSFIAIFILILNKKGFFSNFLNLHLFIDFLITYLFLLIIFNSCNFIDGADGTLLLFLLFLLSMFIFLVSIKKISYSKIFFIYIIFSFIIPMLYFNIIKKIFIGESGSFFIGLFIIVIFLFSLSENILTIYHWLLMSSYFLWDISITFILRILFYRSEFFKAHKDHTYQNFIYLKKNHQLFNTIFMIFKILFCVPSVIFFDLGKISFYVAFIFLTIPILIFIIIYNPLIKNLLNSDSKLL